MDRDILLRGADPIGKSGGVGGWLVFDRNGRGRTAWQPVSGRVLCVEFADGGFDTGYRVR